MLNMYQLGNILTQRAYQNTYYWELDVGKTVRPAIVRLGMDVGRIGEDGEPHWKNSTSGIWIV